MKIALDQTGKTRIPDTPYWFAIRDEIRRAMRDDIYPEPEATERYIELARLKHAMQPFRYSEKQINDFAEMAKDRFRKGKNYYDFRHLDGAPVWNDL